MPFVVSLSTRSAGVVSAVIDLAVTARSSLIARSLIVTTPVFSLIVTPSAGVLLDNDHVFPFFVAVISCLEPFGWI